MSGPVKIGTRSQNAIVAALAALAVGTSAYAVWSVGRPHPSLSALYGDTPVSTATPDDFEVTTTPPADGAEATTTPPADGAAATAEGEDSTSAASVKRWVKAWRGEDADLLVVGDGYSNSPSQWVQVWGELRGQDRPVQIHHWGEAGDITFNDPIKLSEADGPQLTIWSASRAGSRVADAAERLERFADEAGEVDAVLVSLGQSSADEDVSASLDDLLAEIDDVEAKLPVLIAIGPEGLYEPGVGDAMLDWAEDNDDRVAVIDLRPTAPDDASPEEWAKSFEQALSART